MRTIDLARAVGLSSQAVRDYETWGVLPPVERQPNGYRLYTDRHLRAMQTVRALLLAGYEKAQVQELMSAAHGGNLDNALSLIDAHHAALDKKRQQAQHVLQSISTLMTAREDPECTVPIRSLHIGAAAKAIGVPTSTLRFWEQEGLLNPTRDPMNRYRMYDRFQVRCLEVIARLRRADYSFDAIHAVMDELSDSSPGSSFRALEKRQDEISEESHACIVATTAYWNYVSARNSSEPIER
jgi:DNA-binding transcriptional MerR regulator